ncbi:MAG TPA: hypothetical protein VFJ97_17850 [Dermatophilaceae bacterium]|nr:hypothetical protein [Dermatophilaceae bacterium]
MTHRLLLAIALSVLGLVGVASTGAAATTQQDGPVALLPEGPLQFTEGAGSIVLANQTTKQVSITVRGFVVGAGPTGHGTAGTTALALTVVGEQETSEEVRRKLDWGQTLAITVGAPVPGSGVLTLESTTADGVTTLVQREVRAAGDLPRPASSSWTGRVGGWLTWFSGPRNAQVRVPTTPGTCPASWVGPPLTLHDGNAAIQASTACRGDAVVLDLTATPRPGVYRGELAIGGQSTGISVTASAGWMWAALLAVLGTLAAVGQRAWVVNRRPFAVLKEQALELPAQARAADAIVVRAAAAPRAGGRPAFLLEPGVSLAMRQLAAEADRERRSLGWLRSVLPRPVSEVSDDLRLLVAEVDLCAQAIQAWPRAADLFDDLAAALRAHGAQATVSAPALLAGAEALVHPTALHQLRPADVRPFMEELETTAALLRLLPALDLLRAGVAARDRVQYLAADLTRYQQAAQAVREAEDAFATMGWQQLQAAKVDALLEQARSLLAGLPLRTEDHVLTRGLEPAAPTPDLVGDLTFGPGGRWWPARLLPRIERRSVDLLLLLLVAASLTWAGVVLLYAGHAWGSWVDAISALVWGYGAGVVAGPLLAALERVTGRGFTAVAAETDQQAAA